MNLGGLISISSDLLARLIDGKLLLESLHQGDGPEPLYSVVKSLWLTVQHKQRCTARSRIPARSAE